MNPVVNGVVSIEQLRRRTLRAVYVPDAFPGCVPSGVYCRECTSAEFDTWRNRCVELDAEGVQTGFDAAQFRALVLYYCTLTSLDPGGPRLFDGAAQRPEGSPDFIQLQFDLEWIQQMLPPGTSTHLQMVIEALSGFTNPLSGWVADAVRGQSSSSGASSDSAVSPASSTSDSPESGECSPPS